MNTREFVASLTKRQCRYLLRYAGFTSGAGEGRAELRFAVEQNLKAGTIYRGAAARIFGKRQRKADLLAAAKWAAQNYGIDKYRHENSPKHLEFLEAIEEAEKAWITTTPPIGLNEGIK